MDAVDPVIGVPGVAKGETDGEESLETVRVNEGESPSTPLKAPPPPPTLPLLEVATKALHSIRSEEAVKASGKVGEEEASEEEDEEKRCTKVSVRPTRPLASQRMLSKNSIILVRTYAADGESRPERVRVEEIGNVVMTVSLLNRCSI